MFVVATVGNDDASKFQKKQLFGCLVLDAI